MKRIILTLSVVGLGAIAMATGAFSSVFQSTYKIEKTSNLGKAACSVCHTTAHGGKLNPYGTDVQAAMKKANLKAVTAAVLKSVEGLDSDKDGVKNIDEIKKDSNPGVK